LAAEEERVPISFEIGDDSRRIIGAYVGTALIPTLFLLRDHLAAIDRNVAYYTSLFRPLPDEIGTAVAGGIEQISIRTFETNSTLLGHIEAARWAIAYLAYNTMADVWWLLNAMHRRLGTIGGRIIELLEAILATLWDGINVNATLSITIRTTGGGLADLLKELDLWKLLALLAILVGFVASLALAMRLFNANALIAAAAIALFLASITPLIEKLAGYNWSAIAKIGVGLGALALFVAALGGALRFLTKESAAALPELTKLIEKLGSLADQLSKLGAGELLKMTGGLAALAGFVAGLAAALRMLSPAVLNALGPLSEFIDHLGALGIKLADLSVGELLVMGGALAALAGFVAGLAAALRTLSPLMLNALGALGEFIDRLGEVGVRLASLSAGDLLVMAGALAALAGFVAVLTASLSNVSAQTLRALDPLSRFIDTLSSLALRLARLSMGDLLTMAGGLAALAGFVVALEWALSRFDVAVLRALPGLTGLINALKDIAVAMAAMGVGELLTMAAGFALIAAFVWVLAAALKFAEGPLKAIATILTELRGLLNDIAEAGEAVIDFFGGVLGGVFGGGGGGGIMDLLGPLLSPGLGIGRGVLGPIGPFLPIVSPVGGPSAFLPGVARGLATGGGATAGPIVATPITGPGVLAAAAGAPDQSVRVDGGITVNINAERLEADAAEILSDEIIRAIQERLDLLRAEASFRTGVRAEMA
jgi:hypothetical protein